VQALVNAVDENKMSAIQLAAFYGHLDIVAMLLTVWNLGFRLVCFGFCCFGFGFGFGFGFSFGFKCFAFGLVSVWFGFVFFFRFFFFFFFFFLDVVLFWFRNWFRFRFGFGIWYLVLVLVSKDLYLTFSQHQNDAVIDSTMKSEGGFLHTLVRSTRIEQFSSSTWEFAVKLLESQHYDIHSQNNYGVSALHEVSQTSSGFFVLL
jgi:hypothetical protein